MFVTNWISPTKIQKISEITNFFRHYFLSRTEVKNERVRKASRTACKFSTPPAPLSRPSQQQISAI